jgi:hypothetical protein
MTVGLQKRRIFMALPFASPAEWLSGVSGGNQSGQKKVLIRR